jgi:hypothetical protein
MIHGAGHDLEAMGSSKIQAVRMAATAQQIMVRRSPATSSVAERVFLPALHEELGDGWASLLRKSHLQANLGVCVVAWPRFQSLAPDVWQDEPEARRS